MQTEQEAHRQLADAKVTEEKHRRGLPVFGVCALVIIYGIVRIVSFVGTNEAPDFGGILDASIPFFAGVAAMGGSVIWFSRNGK